jgi:predicted nucleic-acid-binding protein
MKGTSVFTKKMERNILLLRIESLVDTRSINIHLQDIVEEL